MAGMEFKDLAGVIFGTSGFAISIYNFVQARVVDKKTREIALNQKRLEVLNTINRSEASLRRANRLFERLSHDAILEGDFGSKDDMTTLIEGNDRQIEGHENSRNMLKANLPDDRTEQRKINELLDTMIVGLNPTASDLPEMEAAKIVDVIRDGWALKKHVTALGKS